MKKIVSFILVTILLFSLAVSANAVDLSSQIKDLRAKFQAGEGPVAGDYSVDYMYYSPVKSGDTKKYPLVVWFHGLGDGNYAGEQIDKNYVAFWASEEYQSRFGNVDGAFILAIRSREELSNTWENSMIFPARAAIDDFIAKNKNNIDLSRVYAGGYSMGGKMVYKMAVAYPDMFAAIFPICPAWSPSKTQAELIKDIPVWLTSSSKDPIVNYKNSVVPGWNNVCATSAVAADCRFTTLGTARMGDGTPCKSNHYAWFAVNNDMFGYDGKAYPDSSTVDGTGKAVTLTSPNGMISWLYSHTSDFDGSKATDMGNLEGQGEGGIMVLVFDYFHYVIEFLKKILAMFGVTLTA